MSEPSRPIGFDPPLAVMIALLAVGGGAYYAQRTLPEISATPRPLAQATGTEWFADFRALDSHFSAARRSGAFAQPVDMTETGSVPLKRPATKTDRLGRDVPPRRQPGPDRRHAEEGGHPARRHGPSGGARRHLGQGGGVRRPRPGAVAEDPRRGAADGPRPP